MGSLLLIAIASYLIGSIPASVWVGQLLYGGDVRNYGSGNAGATNALRVFGWKAALLTTLIDIGKGLVAVLVFATYLQVGPLPDIGGDVNPETVAQIVAGLGAVIGHIFPVWANFRGGKGMNTSCGVLLAITPITTLIALAVFVSVLLIFRYVSLASILAAVAFPAAVAIRKYVFHIDALDTSLLIFGIVLGIGVIVAHRDNIKRLLSGTESRIGQRTKPSGGT